MYMEISENGVNKGFADSRAVLQRAPCALRSPLCSYVLLGDCKEGTKNPISADRCISRITSCDYYWRATVTAVRISQ